MPQRHWEHKRDPYAETRLRVAVMAGNAFAWVEIDVEDLERAKAFYEAVFSFQLEKLESQIPI
jgi:catechol-2,3-dioxygenase